MWDNWTKKETKAIIDGKIIVYDGCADTANQSLEKSKKFYGEGYGWEYIGEGKIYSIGDTIMESSGTHYFFKKNKPTNNN